MYMGELLNDGATYCCSATAAADVQASLMTKLIIIS
jgi:hypothetical protein